MNIINRINFNIIFTIIISAYILLILYLMVSIILIDIYCIILEYNKSRKYILYIIKSCRMKENKHYISEKSLYPIHMAKQILISR